MFLANFSLFCPVLLYYYLLLNGRGQARGVGSEGGVARASCGTLSNLLEPRQARKQFVTPRTANKPNNESKQSSWVYMMGRAGGGKGVYGIICHLRRGRGRGAWSAVYAGPEGVANWAAVVCHSAAARGTKMIYE